MWLVAHGQYCSQFTAGGLIEADSFNVYCKGRSAIKQNPHIKSLQNICYQSTTYGSPAGTDTSPSHHPFSLQLHSTQCSQASCVTNTPLPRSSLPKGTKFQVAPIWSRACLIAQQTTHTNHNHTFSDSLPAYFFSLEPLAEHRLPEPEEVPLDYSTLCGFLSH